MSSVSGKWVWGKFSRRQILSVAGLILLTAFLIVFFKNRSLNLLMRDQKSSIISFYTQNLRSLFEKSPITREDVLNFALYKELPLDKENNQYIHLGNRDGENYFEFRKYSEAKGSDSYNNFVNKLHLNPKQHHEMDSLLEMYKSEIENKILVNDKNTIALNSNLWQMNEALVADMVMFTSDINSKMLADVMPAISAVNRNTLPQIVSNSKASVDSNFIFVTPDSIFVMPYEFDQKKFREEIAKANKDIEIARKEMAVNIDFKKNMARWNKFNKEKFKLNMDSNHLRVQIPPIPQIPEIQIPDMENLNKIINNAVSKIRIKTSSRPASIKPDPDDYDNNEEDTTSDKEGPGNFELNINLPDIPALIQGSLQMAQDSLNGVDWEAFGEKMDSLGRAMESGSGSKKAKIEELKKEFRKLEHKTRVNSKPDKNDTAKEE